MPFFLANQISAQVVDQWHFYSLRGYCNKLTKSCWLCYYPYLELATGMMSSGGTSRNITEGGESKMEGKAYECTGVEREIRAAPDNSRKRKHSELSSHAEIPDPGGEKRLRLENSADSGVDRNIASKCVKNGTNAATGASRLKGGREKKDKENEPNQKKSTCRLPFSRIIEPTNKELLSRAQAPQPSLRNYVKVPKWKVSSEEPLTSKKRRQNDQVPVRNIEIRMKNIGRAAAAGRKRTVSYGAKLSITGRNVSS